MDSRRMVKSDKKWRNRKNWRPHYIPFNESYRQSSILNPGWISPIEEFERNGQIVERVYFKGKPYRRYPNSSNFSDTKYFRCSAKEKSSNTGPLHLHVWEHFKGKIPFGYHIHHRNNNWDRNDIENLEMVTHIQHAYKHRESHLEASRKNIKIAQKYAIKWH